MPRHIRLIACVVTLGLIMSAQAFEPGTDRVCTASADGQQFECHDKSDVAAPPAAARPTKSRPAATAPANPAPVASTASAEPVAPRVSDVPNYLLQAPRASQPVPSANAAEAAAPTSSTAAVDSAPVRELPTAVEKPVAATTSIATAAAPAKADRTESTPIEQESAARSAMTSATSAASPVTIEQAPKTPAAQAAPAIATPTAAPPRTTNIADAGNFLDLPASHYTLVLASVRNARALDALSLALESLPGQLYLLRLDMPDGDWYSLCWSHFEDIDAARGARASLPVDAAITSGWPRKIGLLQKEIAR